MLAIERFTSAQKANVVLWYGISGDIKQAQRRFTATYGRNLELEIPTGSEIKIWFNNFRHTGFVDPHDAELHEEATGEQVEHLVKETSFKHMVSTLGKKLNNWFLDGPAIRTFHPYHMELIKFEVEDMDGREEFAKNQLEHIHKWHHILHSMWFTGEAKFFVDGRVECNNMIYTESLKSEEDINLPHKTIKKYLPATGPHLTVWASMNSELLMGPAFITGDITHDSYKLILENLVQRLHQILPHFEHPVFIHDDSKVHSYADIQAYLEKEFPHHWIGSGSTYVTWPRHSPDLNPINFFLWGYVNSRVYKTPIPDGDLGELETRIKEAFKNISQDLLEEAVEEYKSRLQRVVKKQGNLVDATVYGEEIDYDQLKVAGMYAFPYMQ